jgi:VanZ family protein
LLFQLFKNKNTRIAVCIAWAAIVFVLHVMKVKLDNDSARLFPHSDKVVHFTMFFLLACSMVLAIVQTGAHTITVKYLMTVLMLCAAYGAFLEYLQGTSWVQRDSDVWDWAADVVGSISGILTGRFYFLKGIQWV